MKIKCDFVTNSSSTSFCAWGVRADSIDAESDKFKKTVYSYLKEKNKTNKTLEEYLESGDVWDDFVDYILEDFCIVYAPGIDGEFIGLSPVLMKDDETLLEFKSRFVNILNIFGIGIDVNDVEFLNEEVYN